MCLSGLWLTSYLAIWLVVALLSIFTVGMLRQIGLLRQQISGSTTPSGSKPTIEEDGPPIGSRLPELRAESINGFGVVSSATRYRRGPTLLLFMSPLCEGCQHVVGALNALVDQGPGSVSPVVIMRADTRGCLAFLAVFPLRLPVVCDETRSITLDFDVHRTPFGLLYDGQGILVRKGLASAYEDIQALLGDSSAPELAQSHVFPPIAQRNEGVRLDV